MPTDGMPGGNLEESRQAFPNVEEQIGEDPARFLDVGIYSPDGWPNPLRTAIARIRGIDSLEVLAAWQGVERALGNPNKGGDVREECPRDRILYALEERREELLQEGEREDRLADRREVPDPADVESATYIAVRDGEGVPLEKAQRDAGERRRTDHAGRAAATDGGSEP